MKTWWKFMTMLLIRKFGYFHDIHSKVRTSDKISSSRYNREFPFWLSNSKPDWYPWECRFDSWPHSVGLGSSVALSCGVCHIWSSDPTLLWLWCRLAAAAVIWPLAWELPYAVGAALKKKRCIKFLAISYNFWNTHIPI